jgi:hypothetical protein
MSNSAGKKQIAHHEAGHAVAARLLGVEVAYVDFRGKASAVNAWSAAWAAGEADEARGHEIDAVVSLAGPLAQMRYKGSMVLKSKDWDEGDRTNARGHTTNAVWLRRNPGKPLPATGHNLSAEESEEAGQLLAALSEEAATLIAANWPAVQAVAAAMLDRPFLSQSDLDALIAKAKAP